MKNTMHLYIDHAWNSELNSILMEDTKTVLDYEMATVLEDLGGQGRASWQMKIHSNMTIKQTQTPDQSFDSSI